MEYPPELELWVPEVLDLPDILTTLCLRASRVSVPVNKQRNGPTYLLDVGGRRQQMVVEEKGRS